MLQDRNAFTIVAADDGKLPPVGNILDVKEDNFFGKMPIQEPIPHRWSHVSKEGFGKTRYTWHYMAAGNAAVRFGIKVLPEVPMKQEERAWASPIWYTPAN